MTRRAIFMFGRVSLAVAIVAGTAEADERGVRHQPHILLITTDHQQRMDGPPRVTPFLAMPTLDRW